jgi:hypothetical protein
LNGVGVKLGDIHVGEEYAVRLNYRRLAEEGLWVGSLPYASGGWRGTVLGFEKNEPGHTLVRVEFTSHVLRTKEAREANPDGTSTIWHGHVVDDQDVPVEDEMTFGLLVQSSQVVCEWTEAVVQHSVGSLDEDWQSFDAAPSSES